MSLREKPLFSSENQQQILPLPALFAQSPLSSQALLIDIIKVSGLDPLDYLRLYCQQLLTSQLHLLLAYGIASTATPQDNLIILNKNKPQALAVRALTGLFICQKADYPDRLPSLTLPSQTGFALFDTLGDQWMGDILQTNLTHWVNSLSQSYLIPADQLWQLVAKQFELTFDNLAEQIDVKILNRHRHQLMATFWKKRNLLSLG